MSGKAKPVPAWKAATLMERLRDCARMLYFHGLLTETEYRRALVRLHRALLKGKRSG